MKARRVVIWILGILAALVALGFVALSRMDFCETPTPETTVSEGIDAEPEDFPDLDLSDPLLKGPGPHELRISIIGVEDPTSVPGAPYFILLSDGRWVAGSTDNAGKTQPVYLKQPGPFEFYCCEQAMDLWRRRRTPGGPAGLVRKPGDTGPEKKCSRVGGSGEPSAGGTFKCIGW